MTEQQAQELFRKASESIEVIVSPYDTVVAAARARRRRDGRVVVAAVAAAVLVVGLGSWAVARSTDEPDPAPADVVRAKNPVDVAWYAGGALHLRDVTVELPPVTDLAEVDEGAVVGDAEGTVAFVSSSGRRTVLGEKAPGSPTVVSQEIDWVAWVEERDGLGRIVLWSAPAQEVVRTLPVDPATRLVAIDEGTVYYASRFREFSWEPGQVPEQTARTGLLDVESTTEVYAVASNGARSRIDMVPGFFSGSFRRPGEGAQLSPGGMFALSHQPGTSYAVGPFRPLLYDTRSGDGLPSGLNPGEVALDAAFGANRTVSYLVTRGDGDADSLVVLRTCDLQTLVCHDVIPFAGPDEMPLLAH